LQVFSAVCGLSFYSLDTVFCLAEVFNFNEIQFISYFFYKTSLVLYLKIKEIPKLICIILLRVPNPLSGKGWLEVAQVGCLFYPQ
jgi:hypothetical protein